MVQTLFINLNPRTQNQGMERGTGRGGGGGGCPGDHQRPAAFPASCLSACRSVSSITNKGLLFLTKQHKQEGVRAHTACTRRNTHSTTCTRKAGNKGQALPPSVFIKEKSDQNQLPITPWKVINIFRRGGRERGGIGKLDSQEQRHYMRKIWGGGG